MPPPVGFPYGKIPDILANVASLTIYKARQVFRPHLPECRIHSRLQPVSHKARPTERRADFRATSSNGIARVGVGPGNAVSQSGAINTNLDSWAFAKCLRQQVSNYHLIFGAFCGSDR